MANWSKNNTGKPDQTDIVRSSVDLIAERIDNVEDGLSGDDALTTVDINGGTIDGTPIGATTPNTGVFTDLTASSVSISDLTASSVDITSLVASGTFNGTVGALTPAAGTFTDLVCDSIATDSKEAIKFDVLSFSVTSGTNKTIAHGKGGNIRGISISTATPNMGLSVLGVDSTNITVNSSNNSSGYFTIFYV